jgi:HlyD family secretion protein
LKKIIFIALAVVVLAATVFSILRPKNKGEASIDAGTVKRKDLSSLVNASGNLQPKRKVDVSANTMGTIVHLAVAEGQSVQAGDLLMEIDSFEYRAAVQALNASIDAARSDLSLARASWDKAVQDERRSLELFEKGLASEETTLAAKTNAKIEAARVESARHRITQYEANLAKANHDLEKVTITAPMSGVVTRLNVEEGENAIMGTLNNPGTVLVVIADLGTMEAWVEVDETEVVNLKLGQVAEITIDAFPEQKFTGTVTEIGNSPKNMRTGSSGEAVDFEVKITLENVPSNIRPGLSAKAEIVVAEREAALAVPLGAVTVRQLPMRDKDIRHYNGKRGRKQLEALGDVGFEGLDTTTRDDEDSPDVDKEDIERKDTEGVFILRDGFVKFVPVKIGIAGEDYFEILSGLDEEESVVTGPFRILRELKDGAQIKKRKSSGKEQDKDGSE